MNSYSYNPQEVAAATGDIADTQSPVASTNTNLPPQSSSSYSFNPQEVAQGTNDQAPQSPQMVNTILGQMPANPNILPTSEQQTQQGLQKALMFGGAAMAPGVFPLLESPGAITSALSSIPGISESVAGYIGKMGMNAGLFGGIGALTSPQNPTQGAEIGAGLSAGSDLIPAAWSALKQGAAYFQPQNYAKNIMGILGGGQSLENNAQSLANDVKNAYSQRVQEGANAYNPVFNAVGDSSIYNQTLNPTSNNVYYHVANNKSSQDILDNGLQSISYKPDYPLITNDKNSAMQYNDSINGSGNQNNLLQISLPQSASNSYIHPPYVGDINSSFNMNNQNTNIYGIKRSIPAKYISQVPSVDPNSNYGQLDPSIINSYDRNLTNLNNNFNDNPNFLNAHLLQSQLGSSIRKLQSSDMAGNLSVADRSTMQGYQQAQNSLQNDMQSFLQNKDLQNGINPQQGLTGQYNLAGQNWVQNVVPYIENSKIASIAKGDTTNPSNIMSIFKNPEPEVQKVVQDLGQSANNKILYSELGKNQQNLTPEKLVNNVSNLDQKGLGSYVTPQFQDLMNTLSSKISARNALQKGTGALTGLGIGHYFGFDPEVMGGLGLVGGVTAHALMGSLPSIPGMPRAMNAVGKSYSPITHALIANQTAPINNYFQGS